MDKKENTIRLATPEAHARMLREMETIMNLNVQPVSFRDIFWWVQQHKDECVGHNSFWITVAVTRDCEGVCFNNWVKFVLAAVGFTPEPVTYNKGMEDEHTVVPDAENLYTDHCDWVVKELPDNLTEDDNVPLVSYCGRTRFGCNCNKFCDHWKICKHVKTKTVKDYEWEIEEMRSDFEFRDC